MLSEDFFNKAGRISIEDALVDALFVILKQIVKN